MPHLVSEQHCECDLLLKGCYGSAVEAVALLSFGLVRPAVLSLRSHYELSLMFLFYKDHPVEWRNVQAYRDKPKLPGEIKKYLQNNFENYEARWKSLSKVKERKHEDCYEILSGVAHGTAINSVSTATTPEELIEPQDVVSQTVELFLSVGESLSDINLSCTEVSWVSLSEELQSALSKRYGGKNPIAELSL